MGMHPTFTYENSFVLADLIFSESRQGLFLKMIDLGLLSSSQIPAWERVLPSVSPGSHSLSKLADRLRVLMDPVVSKSGYISTEAPLEIVRNIINGLKLFNAALCNFETIKNLKVLDFGCGVYRPLSVAIILCANGFERAYAFEPYPIDAEISYLAAVETVNQIMQYPQRFNFFGVRDEVMVENLSKINFVNVKQKIYDFCHGDVKSINLGGVALLSDLNLVENGGVDFIASNAVLEHVADFGYYTDMFFSKLSADGICLHVVDFLDHRYYDDNSLHPYEKYYDQVLHEINGLLPSEMEIEFLKSGFGVKKAVRQYVPESSLLNEPRPLVGKYKGVPMDQLREHVNYYYLEKNDSRLASSALG